MIDAFFGGLAEIFQLPAFFFLLLGAAIGFWVGILPGLERPQRSPHAALCLQNDSCRGLSFPSGCTLSAQQQGTYSSSSNSGEATSWPCHGWIPHDKKGERRALGAAPDEFLVEPSLEQVLTMAYPCSPLCFLPLPPRCSCSSLWFDLPFYPERKREEGLSRDVDREASPLIRLVARITSGIHPTPLNRFTLLNGLPDR